MADLVSGGRVAKRSFFVQIIVGLFEIILGTFTLSIALIADGNTIPSPTQESHL